MTEHHPKIHHITVNGTPWCICAQHRRLQNTGGLPDHTLACGHTDQSLAKEIWAEIALMLPDADVLLVEGECPEGKTYGGLTFIEYIPARERTYIAEIINAALERGLSLSVNDGEEWTLRVSEDPQAVADALGTTGEDWLALSRQDEDGKLKRVGTFWFIYNNGSEDDPEIVVADYTYTEGDPTMEEVLIAARARAGL